MERRVQGHLDQSILTERGRGDASKVAIALRDLGFDAAYSSPLKRAKQTADLVLSGLKRPPAQSLQTIDLLKEISLPIWEGLPFTEVEANYPEAFRDWQTAPHLLKMSVPGSDGQLADFYPVPALFEQAQDFWQQILPRHHGQTVLIVAHSGINRALISTAIGLPPHRYHSIHQANCGISVLNFSGGFGDPVQMESLNLTDHLGQPLPKPKQGNRHLRLLLVRHGETDWNRQKRFQGQIDVPLNQTGRLQSQQAATFLQSIPLQQAFTSPMLRPKETAEIILQHHSAVSLSLEPDLAEIAHGTWEGRLETEIEQDYPGLLQQWQLQPEAVQMPEGENLQQVWERAIVAWDRIVRAADSQAKVGNTLVVAHDAINKAILCSILGLGPEYFWVFKQGNGAVSVIDYPQGVTGQPVLTAMNITSHQGGVLDTTAAGAL